MQKNNIRLKVGNVLLDHVDFLLSQTVTCILANRLAWLAYRHHGSSVGIELLGVREERTQRVRHRVDRSLPDLGRPEVRSVVPRDDALNEDAEVGALSQPRGWLRACVHACHQYQYFTELN